MLNYECMECDCKSAILIVCEDGHLLTRCTACGDESDVFETIHGIEIDPKSFGGVLLTLSE